MKLSTRTSLSGASPPLRRIVFLALGCAALANVAIVTPALAQISTPGGPQSQDNRSAPMGAQAEAATATVHESHAPQAAEAKGAARGPSAKKGHQPEGTGGFNNGLYGTGTGSNK